MPQRWTSPDCGCSFEFEVPREDIPTLVPLTEDQQIIAASLDTLIAQHQGNQELVSELQAQYPQQESYYAFKCWSDPDTHVIQCNKCSTHSAWDDDEAFYQVWANEHQLKNEVLNYAASAYPDILSDSQSTSTIHNYAGQFVSGILFFDQSRNLNLHINGLIDDEGFQDWCNSHCGAGKVTIL